MDSLSAWASSQPIWAQVFVGLCLFFFGIPLVLLLLYQLARFLGVIANAGSIATSELSALIGWLLKHAIEVFVLLVLASGTGVIAWFGAMAISSGDGQVAFAVSAFLCLAALIAFCICRWYPPVRRQLQRWIAELDGKDQQ
jgi:hypothetical protein